MEEEILTDVALKLKLVNELQALENKEKLETISSSEKLVNIGLMLLFIKYTEMLEDPEVPFSLFINHLETKLASLSTEFFSTLEEKVKQVDFKAEDSIKKVRLDLEPERESNLNKIKLVYSAEVKKISRTKLLKIAIDNLVNDLEKQATEEEALEYIRTLYKEAEF